MVGVVGCCGGEGRVPATSERYARVGYCLGVLCSALSSVGAAGLDGY